LQKPIPKIDSKKCNSGHHKVAVDKEDSQRRRRHIVVDVERRVERRVTVDASRGVVALCHDVERRAETSSATRRVTVDTEHCVVFPGSPERAKH
jgi:hypothetical protein